MGDRLRCAACILPDGLKLHFYVGWRHIAFQKSEWHKTLKKLKEKFPEKSDSEIERMTKVFVANPYGNSVAPHQTGGAVDLTLVDKNGNTLDMGTQYIEFSNKTPTKSKNITAEQRQNRKILSDVLSKVGLQNYPGEWWHYSYGDRAWAAYKRKPFAIYGETFTPDYKLKKEEMKYKER